jgi:hypothetical protein
MTEAQGGHRRSGSQLYALVVGASLALAGALGFFYEAGFGTGDVERDDVFGLLDVNGWHNVVHLSSGLVGLALARSFGGARAFACGFGAIYAVVAIAGFIAGDPGDVLGLIPVNTEDNVLHTLLGAAGLATYLAGSPEPPPTTV